MIDNIISLLWTSLGTYSTSFLFSNRLPSIRLKYIDAQVYVPIVRIIPNITISSDGIGVLWTVLSIIWLWSQSNSTMVVPMIGFIPRKYEALINHIEGE